MSSAANMVKGTKVSWNPKDKDFPEEKYKAPSFLFQQHPDHNSEEEWEERHGQVQNSLTPQEKCDLEPLCSDTEDWSGKVVVTLLTSNVCMRLGLIASFISTVNAPLTPYKTKAWSIASDPQETPTFSNQNSTFSGLPFLATVHQSILSPELYHPFTYFFLDLL